MRKIKGDESMRLAPGLHRIGSDVVNPYLVEDAARVTIVDAGRPGLWRELQEELTQWAARLPDAQLRCHPVVGEAQLVETARSLMAPSPQPGARSARSTSQ
jgi:hypothetical protein